MTDTLKLTEALIRRPSVTPDDKGCQQLMAEPLERAGFRIEAMPFGEVTNLWASLRCENPGENRNQRTAEIRRIGGGTLNNSRMNTVTGT